MTDCIEQPQGVYPPEPGATALTDAYIVALKSWGNAVLGIATTDRLLWRGERRCIRKLQDVGQIR